MRVEMRGRCRPGCDRPKTTIDEWDEVLSDGRAGAAVAPECRSASACGRAFNAGAVQTVTISADVAISQGPRHVPVLQHALHVARRGPRGVQHEGAGQRQHKVPVG